MKKIKFFLNYILSIFNLKMIKSSSLNKLNLEIEKEPLIESEFKDLLNKIKEIYENDYSPLALYTVYTTCKYIHDNNIKGSIIEVGVYRGVCVAMMLLFFSSRSDYSRDIYLYDTFKGMTKPNKNDFGILNNKLLNEGDNFASLKTVQNLLSKINYNREKIHYVVGDIKDTVFKIKHQKISLLRQDTDFYESTLHTLNGFYDYISPGGFLIFDDYGHWKGQYEAVNKFYNDRSIKPLLIRTSRKERIEIKY
tara:strand:+ start:3972 stop:4724 length:753 start_codon:yes stop_codon:yes gene_type:complete